MKVVIVGGGFGGLACAQALGESAHEVVVIDRKNHNLFQPLLYQVATAALSPADIAEPIRKTLRRAANVTVLMGEVTGVDRAARTVTLRDGRREAYDRLVLATGSEYSYFGHEDWARHAPGLKTIEDARTIRARLLRGFEEAENSDDPQARARLMTSVVVGGGPTGVEMAGAIAELARWTLSRDFRRIDPTRARVVLVEAGPRLLAGFPPELSAYAAERLEALGVEVMLESPVEAVSEGGVIIAGVALAASTIVWGAGVRGSPAAEWLGVEPGAGRRVPVNPDLSLPGDPHVFVLGDTALALGEDGAPLPALAQVAKQQGEHLGRALAREAAADAPLPPFRFRNRGNTAVIGRNAAVFDFGRRRLKGRPAWLLWAIVHVYLLVSFEKRLLVSLQWLWRYFTFQRGARLIP